MAVSQYWLNEYLRESIPKQNGSFQELVFTVTDRSVFTKPARLP